MTKAIGQATICTNILPNKQGFLRMDPRELSSAAKFRLRFIENYLNITRDVSETCRLFGIARSLFYKWFGRYDPGDLSTLENKSCRPHRVRSVSYDADTVKLIRSYRENQDTATYSARKLAHILRRDYPDQPKFHLSRSTIGRIIKKFNLFFAEVVKVANRRSKAARKAWGKLKARKPYGLKPDSARTLIEFDMKHIHLPGNQRYYAFCAIDVFTRESIVHVAKTASSHQARLALEKVIAAFAGKCNNHCPNIAILNDNGSENLGEAWDWLERQEIMQYFARPHTPKDKPYIERLIGTLQRECLDQYRGNITNLDDLDYFVTKWLNNYHFFRPHDSLGELTPDEYCAKLGLTIARRKVSMG